MWVRRKKIKEPEIDASMHAMDEAADHLVEVQLRADEVKQIASAAREVRTRNHFAQQLKEMIDSPRHRRAHT